jgi:hypothetical protein
MTDEPTLGAKFPPAEVRSEIQEFLSIMNQRRRVSPRAALVRFGAGLIAALFRATLAGADHLRCDRQAAKKKRFEQTES